MSPKLKTLFTLLTCLLLAASLPAQVMLNEVLYDTQSTDDTSIMYTEIYGPPGTNIDGWSLVATNGNGGTVYLTVELEGDIPDDGYFVVGGSNVANVDQVSPHDFQNAGGTSGPQCDGLDLFDAQSNLIDHLCYGECGANEECDGEGGSNAPDPFPSQGVNSAIARIPDHTDTDNNGNDWQATVDLTPGEPNEGEPCEPVEAELADVRENNASGVPEMLGTFVIVEGIVNVDNLVLQDISNFYIQDENAGVNVFGGGATTIVEGDCVRVSAWVGQFNGLTELLSSGGGNCVFSVQVTNHVDPPDPVVLTGASFFEAFEGMLAQINNVSIVGGDWPGEGQNGNLEITDGEGTITLRIIDDTDIDGSNEPDSPFTVVGIITQFDSESPYDEDYQITPRYLTDIISTAADENPLVSTPAEFRLDGAFPNPFNSTTNLRFTVGGARELTVQVFDLLGREVTSEKLTALTPGSHVWNWTPTGATGLYIVRLESASLTQTAKVLYLK